jgi:hypothetical protein
MPSDSLRKTLDAIKNFAESISKHYESQKGQIKTPLEVHGNIEAGLPKEISEYYKSEQADRPTKNLRDKYRFRLEIGGIVLALVIAIATVCTLKIFNGQLGEMRSQTTAIQGQMRLEQRPWIKIESGPINIKQGFPLSTTFTFTNTGQSPASHISGELVLDVFPDGQTFPLQRTCGVLLATGILFRDGKLVQPVISQRMSSDGKMCDPKPLSPEDGKGAQNGLYFFAAGARVTYDDEFGVHHWTQYCQWFGIPPHSYRAQSCTAFNATDTNILGDNK